MTKYDVKGLLPVREGLHSPTFSLKNRIGRALWKICYVLFFRFTPPSFRRYRIWVLRRFGADIVYSANIYPSVIIWAPWNLKMAADATLGPGVNCYNIAEIVVGKGALVSQRTHLCTGTHLYKDKAFPLVARPIIIGDNSWICAEAFVGPGVVIGDHAILGARAVGTKDLQPNGIYAGNPAVFVKNRYN